MNSEDNELIGGDGTTADAGESAGGGSDSGGSTSGGSETGGGGSTGESSDPPPALEETILEKGADPPEKR